MSTVSIVKCNDYQSDKVYAALSRSLELLGGIEKYISPGMKVLLKCNLLMKKKPEESCTTHPEVAAALARLVREAGAIPIIADSPGGLFTERALRGIYKVCGIDEIAARDGIELNYNVGEVEVRHPEGAIIKNMTVIKLLEEVDAVISVAKLKTHGMTLYTGAVKNLFGVIPGTTKAEYHLRMKKLHDFSNMLVDVCTYVKPVLSVMDAIVGMEGHGPSAGDPRHIGTLLASASPFALDVTASSIIGIVPEKVCTIKRAAERGLCSSRLEDIDLVGDPIQDLYIKDYKIPEHKQVGFIDQFLGSGSKIAQYLNYYFGPKPIFIHEGCIGCRDCEKNCPPKVITMKENRPIVDLKECIRCYCCQELCPEKTVVIKRSWLFKTFK